MISTDTPQHELEIHEKAIAQCNNCNEYDFIDRLSLCWNISKVSVIDIADGNAIRLTTNPDLIWIHSFVRHCNVTKPVQSQTD